MDFRFFLCSEKKKTSPFELEYSIYLRNKATSRSSVWFCYFSLFLLDLLRIQKLSSEIYWYVFSIFSRLRRDKCSFFRIIPFPILYFPIVSYPNLVWAPNPIYTNQYIQIFDSANQYIVLIFFEMSKSSTKKVKIMKI